MTDNAAYVNCSQIECFACRWLAALWNATGLGTEPTKCKAHR